MLANRGQNVLTPRATLGDSISGDNAFSTTISHCGSHESCPSSSFFTAIGVGGACFKAGLGGELGCTGCAGRDATCLPQPPSASIQQSGNPAIEIARIISCLTWMLICTLERCRRPKNLRSLPRVRPSVQGKIWAFSNAFTPTASRVAKLSTLTLQLNPRVPPHLARFSRDVGAPQLFTRPR